MVIYINYKYFITVIQCLMSGKFSFNKKLLYKLLYKIIFENMSEVVVLNTKLAGKHARNEPYLMQD